MFLLAVFGFAGSLWAADPLIGTWKLNVSKSNFSPAMLGRKKVSELVETGPYKYLSNPMYGVGQLQVYAIAIYYDSVYGIIFGAVNQALVFLFYFTVEKPFIIRTYIWPQTPFFPQVPKPAAGSKSAFIKFTIRKSIDFPIVNCAASVSGGNVRICLNAVYNKPYRATAAEEFIKGKAIKEESADTAGAAAVQAARALPGDKTSGRSRLPKRWWKGPSWPVPRRQPE